MVGPMVAGVVSAPLDLAPLDIAAIRAGAGNWFAGRISVVDETSSTNADLLAAAAAGAPEATVLVAEWQHAGRGRFDRVWVSPPRAGLTFSVIVRPAAVPTAQWTWLPLLTGLAVRAAVRTMVGVDTEVDLKWPNDLLVGPRQTKAAGILAEIGTGAVVVGVGINVSHTAAELPGPAATSLALAFPGRPVERGELLVAVLREFERRYRFWADRDPDPDAAQDALSQEYAEACSTIGRQVRVTTGADAYSGRAVAVDGAGRLLVDTPAGPRVVSAGDIAHLSIRT